MNVADKSECIEGNTKNGPIIYNCYPANELCGSKWLLAINSVIFDSSETISITCKITCNFITSRKRNSLGEVVIEEQVLNTFHLKTSSAATRGIFRFCEIFLLSITEKNGVNIFLLFLACFLRLSFISLLSHELSFIDLAGPK